MAAQVRKILDQPM